ncbi:MAG: hypothetical protein WKF47_05605 [Geodermatophilaceae bacterium]
MSTQRSGRTDWAVHVALWQAGQLVAGAVALPALGVTLSTSRADGPARRRTAAHRDSSSAAPERSALVSWRSAEQVGGDHDAAGLGGCQGDGGRPR